MRPIAEMPVAVAGRIAIVFADIDDTLTHEGRLPACAYQALEDLASAGLKVAPITGRPAGWCDMIARFWPVAGVVGENGAFYFAYDMESRRMRRAYAASTEARRANRARLEALGERILASVPGSAISADQAYREADLAIDFREDVAPLAWDEVSRIKAIFEADGAVAKISSIHVNGWFGDYDKLAMSRRFASEVLAFDMDRDRGRVVFVGDSPNDEPMFAFFENGCGVANIRAFAGQLEAPPAYVTEAAGGHGFVEVARHLLKAREGLAHG